LTLNDIEEKQDVAELHPEIVSRMVEYAQEAHAENLKGSWIDRSLRFGGHQEK
jgi:hypothetical protein